MPQRQQQRRQQRRQQRIKHPVDFITIANKSNHNDSTKSDGDSSAAITKLFSLDDDSKCYRDFVDGCSHPTADLLSFDGALTPPQYPFVVGGNCVDGISEMSSTFSLSSTLTPVLSRTFDHSVSCSDLSELTLDDELSSGSITSARNYLCLTLYPEFSNPSSAPTPRTLPKRKYHPKWGRNKTSHHKVSCESTAATSTTTSNLLSSVSQPSSHSNRRVRELKNKLRSIEHRYYGKKLTSSKRSVARSTDAGGGALCGSDDLVFCSEIPLSHRIQIHRALYRAVPVIQRTLQVVVESICVNLILYMVYLLFEFYKYSFSMAIQGSTTLYDTTLFSD